MPATLVALAFTAALAPSVDLPTLFWGIDPDVTAVAADTKLKPKQYRAVVLVHGLYPRIFQAEKAEKPEAHEWQHKSGRLVKALAADADVYGFSYAQTHAVDDVAFSRGFRDGVAALKEAGYTEIVLVGHSAGGLICRRFVEAFPQAGITKVIAVGSPFAGSGWAKLPGFTLPKTQVAFIHSLEPDTREAYLKGREVLLPRGMEFGCVICKVSRVDGDTVVAVRSQWPDDLQTQGVPAVVAACNHFEAMTGEAGVKEVVKLVGGKIVRWDDEKTATARKVLFGDTKSEKR